MRSGREQKSATRRETVSSLRFLNQPGVSLSGALQRQRRRWWIEQQVDKLLLLLHREANDVGLLNRSVGGLLCGSHYKIAHAAALERRRALHDGERLRRDARLDARAAVGLLLHCDLSSSFVLYGSLPYLSP